MVPKKYRKNTTSTVTIDLIFSKQLLAAEAGWGLSLTPISAVPVGVVSAAIVIRPGQCSATIESQAHVVSSMQIVVGDPMKNTQNENCDANAVVNVAPEFASSNDNLASWRVLCFQRIVKYTLSNTHTVDAFCVEYSNCILQKQASRAWTSNYTPIYCGM